MKNQHLDFTTDKKSSSEYLAVLEQLDMKTFANNQKFLIIGKRGSGKSFLIKQIIYQMFIDKKVNECCVFSPTDKMTNFYVNFTKHVSYECDFSLVKKIMELQKQRNIEGSNTHKLLIVFDDGLSEKDYRNDTISDLIKNGHHLNITTIFAMQFSIGMTPELRSNFDYVFLMKDDAISSIKRLYDHYGGVFPTFNLFNSYIKNYTKDYNALVILNTITNSLFSEKVKIFKANMVNNAFMVPGVDVPFDKNVKEVTIKIDKIKYSNRIQIKSFDLKLFVDNPAIVIVAKRGSGKSWIVRDILHHLYKAKQIDECCVINPTDKMSGFYTDFTEQIYHQYDPTIMQNILNLQIERIRNKKINGEPIKKVMVVMDDCMGQKGTWVRDNGTREILFNGRHYGISYILTMQFPLGITPELRSNFDYIFLLAEDYISNLKRVYDHYAGMFPSFDSFRQIFGQLTGDYGSMVIVNRGVRKGLFEKIHHYKASNDNDKFLIPQIYPIDDMFYEKHRYDKTKESSLLSFDVESYIKEKHQRNKTKELSNFDIKSCIETITETDIFPESKIGTKNDISEFSDKCVTPKNDEKNVTFQSFDLDSGVAPKNDCKITFRSFDLDSCVSHPAIILIGKKGSGKSWLVKNILHELCNNKKIDECCIFAPHEKYAQFYNNFTERVYHKYNSDIIQNILSIQAERMRNKKINGEPVKNVMVVFDDCLGQNGTLVRDNPIQELLFNGRHYGISYILTMPSPLKIVPELRSNFDYIFLLAEDYISNLKRVYDHYAGMFPNFDLFRQIFGQLTDDYGSMVIVNRGVRKSIFEKIYHYKAIEITDNFLIPNVHIGELNYLKNNKLINNINTSSNCESEHDAKQNNLLLKIIKFNNDIVEHIKDDKLNDARIEIFENITKCNDLIFKTLSKHNA